MEKCSKCKADIRAGAVCPHCNQDAPMTVEEVVTKAKSKAKTTEL